MRISGMISKLVGVTIGATLITFINILYFNENSDYSGYIKVYYKATKDINEYLINTSNCQIPDNNPFSDDILGFIKKEEYTNCRNLQLLTYIEKDFGLVTLNVNRSLLPQYSWFEVTCCYSEIHRVKGNDDKIWFTPCVTFKENVAIYHPHIKVVCRNTFYFTVYENVHATTLLDDVKDLKTLNKNSTFSILLVGIDSISKQSLRRAMPETHEYLENNFINLRGYQKVGDNTFPNLMAILTGLDLSEAYGRCPFLSENEPDSANNKEVLSRCDFIWNHFSNSGYVTALSEDACPIGTFNYLTKGFFDPPTDYYYRPYFLAAEQLSTVKSKCHNRFCSGPENTGERVMNSAKDFSITLKNQPTFGLFWMNSFSHDNFNCPSAMDDSTLRFLSDQSFVNSLENTIFVFFSDHGYRFGDIRNTVSGWIEERLPFIYIRIPDIFKRSFPREYNNLVINSRRLTSPYDLHNTLQHLLDMSNNKRSSPTSQGCAECQSLFNEVAETRTCDEAGVARNWCTCTTYIQLSKSDPRANDVAQFILDEVNKFIDEDPEGYKCDVYILDSIHSAGISPLHINKGGEEVHYVLMIIRTDPEAMFEATVEVPVKYPDKFKIVNEISRTDRYGSKGSCMETTIMRKYCHCDWTIVAPKKTI